MEYTYSDTYTKENQVEVRTKIDKWIVDATELNVEARKQIIIDIVDHNNGKVDMIVKGPKSDVMSFMETFVKVAGIKETMEYTYSDTYTTKNQVEVLTKIVKWVMAAADSNAETEKRLIIDMADDEKGNVQVFVKGPTIKMMSFIDRFKKLASSKRTKKSVRHADTVEERKILDRKSIEYLHEMGPGGGGWISRTGHGNTRRAHRPTANASPSAPPRTGIITQLSNEYGASVRKIVRALAKRNKKYNEELAKGKTPDEAEEIAMGAFMGKIHASKSDSQEGGVRLTRRRK